MLYQAEAAGVPMPEVVAHFWQDASIPEEVRSFSERLALGTERARQEIDVHLSSCLDNWRVERLALVDRNVLRLAIYEFLHEHDTPRIVVIDEAIEVAKKFGGEDSGQFVNGILDALRRRLEEAEAIAPGPSSPRGPNPLT